MADAGLLPRHAYTANEMISGYKVIDCRIVSVDASIGDA
jgi:hypothetical protein